MSPGGKEGSMKSDFIETENVRRLARVVDALVTAGEGEPRMGMVTGSVGLGKSWAVDDCFVNRGCLYIRACASWTPNAMLRAVLTKAGLRPAMATAQNLERCVALLTARKDEYNPAHNLLIIDEADYLLAGARPGTPPVILDTVRDLHDSSNAPVLLVGEPDLLEQLEHLAKYSGKYRRFWDRILISERFQPLSVPEIQTMAERLTGLQMPEDAAAHLKKSQEGNVRLVIIALRAAERMAKSNRLRDLPLDLVDAAQKKAAKTKRYFDGKKRGLTRRAA